MSDAETAEEEAKLAESIATLEAALGHVFIDKRLVELAITHSSYAHEHRENLASNERLEFLGDAVIGMVGAHLLYLAHPDWPEGDLTRALARLVDQRGLAKLAKRIDVGPHLRFGRTERAGGSQKNSILSNTMEALIAAMYLDAGLEPVEAFARREFAEALAPGSPRVELDPKTRFQEWTMAELGVFPVYRLLFDSEREDDTMRFTIEVCVNDVPWAEGMGRSKRLAERMAAEAAYRNRESYRASFAEAERKPAPKAEADASPEEKRTGG